MGKFMEPSIVDKTIIHSLRNKNNIRIEDEIETLEEMGKIVIEWLNSPSGPWYDKKIK